MEHLVDIRDDAALVGAVQAGDRTAFEPLLLRHYPSILRLCDRLMGATTEAYDVAQDAAVHAFLALDRLHDPARFGAWLHAIAANLARKALRRRHLLSLEVLDLPEYQHQQWTQALPTPDDLYARREVEAAIVTALHDLSPVNRDAVIGVFLDGYSYGELADLLNVPVSTVRGRLFQGRRQLKHALAPLHPNAAMAHDDHQEGDMDTEELVVMYVHGFCAAPAHGETLVLLRTVGAAHDVPLRLRAREMEVLHDWWAHQTLPHPAVDQALTPRLLDTLGARLHQITIHQLVDSACYVTLTLDHGRQRSNVDAQLGDALILATQSSAPIYLARPVLDALGIEIAPLLAQWQQDPGTRAQWTQQMRERVQREDPRSGAPALLTSDTRQHVDAWLARVLDEVNGRLVLLVHRRGRVVAWYGAGNAEIIDLFSGVRTLYEQNPRDLRNLLVYHTLLVPELWPHGGMVTQQPVGDAWRLELGWASARPDDQWPRDRQSLRAAARALEDLLPDDL